MPTTPSGNPLLAQLQPVGQRAAAQHLADRVGQPGDLAQTGGDAVDALRVERQPVEHRLGGARRPGGVEIFGVGRQDLWACASTASAAACSARSLTVVVSDARTREATRARRAASCTSFFRVKRLRLNTHSPRVSVSPPSVGLRGGWGKCHVDEYSRYLTW